VTMGKKGGVRGGSERFVGDSLRKKKIARRNQGGTGRAGKSTKKSHQATQTGKKKAEKFEESKTKKFGLDNVPKNYQKTAGYGRGTQVNGGSATRGKGSERGQRKTQFQEKSQKGLQGRDEVAGG